MSRSSCRGRRGFTLVELLVVIAIIGVLVALLLPALSSARSAANASGSASNMSGFGRGFELYANSNNGNYSSGAFDHCRDGDIRTYGWVADLISQKVSQPGKALDQGSRNKVSKTVAEYMGVTDANTTASFDTGLAAGRWDNTETPTPTFANKTGEAYFGGDAKAKEVWDQGYNTNYATTWHFSRGDPSGTNGYTPGTKSLSDGDGPLSQNHLAQGNTTAARVALMGPARAVATPVVAADATTIVNFAGSPVVKANDLLTQSFTGGMTVSGTVTGDTAAGVKIHEFSAIEPLHQPKTAGGGGGHAPVLFADLHVEKVQDTVTSGATEVKNKGDGYLGNAADGSIGALGYQEVADQMWTRRLRTSQTGSYQ
jgi:prepilin-type N-terminal cleavage/methylation domain-containing protein/prepilin-type processing-associated H-X9-DG protein